MNETQIAKFLEEAQQLGLTDIAWSIILEPTNPHWACEGDFDISIPGRTKEAP